MTENGDVMAAVVAAPDRGATMVKMSREAVRSQQLARRVGWLDRWRRLLAIGCALLFAPALIARLDAALGAEWPRVHATALALALGFVVWCAAEVAFAWLAAVWETELARLSRRPGLPRAELVIRSRWSRVRNGGPSPASRSHAAKR